jgi:hypothetical protein
MTFVIQQKPKKPPQTKTQKFQLLKYSTTVLDVDISVEVLPDGQTADASKAGKGVTSCIKVGSIGPKGEFTDTPTMMKQRQGGADVVVRIGQRAQVKGLLRIQTVYGTGASPAGFSAYGRGTTPQDVFAGNVTLGFHESCHQQDYLDYLRTAPFPGLHAKIGMTIQDFQAAYRRFEAAVEAYFKRMHDISYRCTDEAGYKKTTYKAQGRRPKPLGAMP